MADENRPRQRYGEAFWRAHHEAWKRSDLNQREYCETQGIPLKALGNWRAKFKAEPQLAMRKLLYRRGVLSHSLSHSPSHPLSHTLSHVTYPSSLLPAPIVPPAREGHNSVGTRDIMAIVAQWLACALPCRRFVATLTNGNARLGADVPSS